LCYFSEDSVQKRYAGAKSISSDDFFRKQSGEKESSESLGSRFQGATAISSADVFHEEVTPRDIEGTQ
jgi:hypothetical protein